MTRVIKFRGMDLEGRWFYGLPCIITVGRDRGSYISNSCGMPMAYDIRPETLTQFTGLFDGTKFDDLTIVEQKNWLKNNKQEDWKGKEIYEGDVVKSRQPLIDDEALINTVIFKKGGFYLNCEKQLDYLLGDYESMFIEVIGNIFENGDLLNDK